MKGLLIISVLLFALSAQSQNYQSAASGVWNLSANWTPNAGLGYPNAVNVNATINTPDTIRVFGAEICRDLAVDSRLEVFSGSVSVDRDVELNTGGVIDISGGIITIEEDFEYDGTLNITSTSSYVEVKETIISGGNDKVVINDGSIRIYSELDF